MVNAGEAKVYGGFFIYNIGPIDDDRASPFPA